MSEDDLDKILEELKNDDSISSLNQPPSSEKLNITDENVGEFVMQKVGKLVESGIETVEAIQQTIASGFEAEELQAFSGLLNAVTNAAETLNKINIQRMKSEAAKEIKEMDIAAKKQLGSGNGGGQGNTNVLIATREEVIERFLNKNKKVLEAEFTDVEQEDIDE